MSAKFNKSLLINVASLITVFLMMAAAAMMRDGRLLGKSIQKTSAEPVSAISYTDDGSTVINTTTLAKGVTGYSGPVPVTITITDGRIDSISPLPNSETPGFFSRAVNSGLLDRWRGLTPEEALAKPVDAVTGATYSSKALIANVKAGLSEYAAAPPPAPVRRSAGHRSVDFYVALAVLLGAAIVPLMTKNKRYRLVQELLNVAVLGFWAGTFVDYTAMLGLMSNSLTASAGIITLLMLIVAFIYPLFGRKGHYCAWVCPLGSLQELAGRCNPNHKLNLSPALVKILTKFRMILWCLLMICLWTGFFTSWIDYELFTAFMVREAALGVVIAGGVIVLLSLFVNRPYCRFICPTGTLMRMSQDIDTK